MKVSEVANFKLEGINLKLKSYQNNELCYFIYLEDDTLIGYCDLRFGNSKSLYYYGNIGYRINEPYRGHNYAYKACKKLLELAGELKISELWITCSPENIASKKTILKLGGQLIETTKVPIWHPLYTKEPIKEIYRVKTEVNL